jgi:hypothetical protein
VHDVDFLPAWYPRMRKNRSRMILLSMTAGGGLLITGLILAACCLLN